MNELEMNPDHIPPEGCGNWDRILLLRGFLRDVGAVINASAGWKSNRDSSSGESAASFRVTACAARCLRGKGQGLVEKAWLADGGCPYLVPGVLGEPRMGEDPIQEAAIPVGALAGINPVDERLLLKHHFHADPRDDRAIADAGPALHGAGAHAEDFGGIATGNQGWDCQSYSYMELGGIARRRPIYTSSWSRQVVN